MFVDFHSHILPGADHGSSSLETSIQQVELAEKAGVDTLIATPHFYPRYESAEEFLQRRQHSFRRLSEALPEHSPRLLLGSETQLCRGLDRLPELEQLCVAGTKVLLLELPRSFSFDHYAETLDALLYERKLTVVLAHIDRYSPSVIDLLLDMGFLGQLNLEAFDHWRSRNAAVDWVRRDVVVALGSDMHGTKNGYKDLPKAKKFLGDNLPHIMRRCQTLLGI